MLKQKLYPLSENSDQLRIQNIDSMPALLGLYQVVVRLNPEYICVSGFVQSSVDKVTKVTKSVITQFVD